MKHVKCSALFIIGLSFYFIFCDTQISEIEKASLYIVVTNSDNNSLAKNSIRISHIRIILNRDSTLLRDMEMEDNDGLLYARISGLYPDTTYHLTLLGMQDSDAIIIFSEKDNIHIAAGRENKVELAFFKFLPELVAPVDNSSLKPGDANFEWTSVPGADSYILKVSTDESFGSSYFIQYGLSETSYSTNIFSVPGYYYWKVACSSEYGGSSIWTDKKLFVIN